MRVVTTIWEKETTIRTRLNGFTRTLGGIMCICFSALFNQIEANTARIFTRDVIERRLEESDNTQIKVNNSPVQVQKSFHRELQTSNMRVLDLGLDVPNPRSGQAVRSNGVTFTLKNLSAKDAFVIGFELYITVTPDPIALQVLVRPGEDQADPLNQSSDQWKLVSERSNISVDSSTPEFVSMSLDTKIKIPAESGVTVFVFTEVSPSLANIGNSDVATTGIDGILEISSGTAVQKVPSHDTWVSIPKTSFLGKVFYESTLFTITDLPAPYTYDSMPIWQQGDTPVNTYGLAFDLYSITGCNITSLDIHTSFESEMIVEVFMRKSPSNFQDQFSDPTTWTLVSKAAIVGQGQTKPTKIPSSEFEKISMDPDSTLSLYITSTQAEIISIPARSLSAGDAVDGAQITNDDGKVQLDMLVGKALTRYPIGLHLDESEYFGDDSIFSGKIYFEEGSVVPTEAPTASPTAMPTPVDTGSPTQAPTPKPTTKSTTKPTAPPTATLVPELESQLKLTITGVSRRTIRRLQSATIQNDDIRAYFEETGSKFLSKILNQGNGPPINLKGFIVSPDITDADLTSRRRLAEDEEENDEDGRHLQEELEVYTTILGEYSPPPVVDFSTLTEDSFNDDGDEFITELKTDPPPAVGDTFKEARSIKAESVTFPKPKMDVATKAREPEPETNNFMLYVYIGCGCAAALVLIIIIVCCIVKGRKKRKKAGVPMSIAPSSKGASSVYEDTKDRHDHNSRATYARADYERPPSQRFWSRSGRHILSGSGRRIWRADEAQNMVDTNASRNVRGAPRSDSMRKYDGY